MDKKAYLPQLLAGGLGAAHGFISPVEGRGRFSSALAEGAGALGGSTVGGVGGALAGGMAGGAAGGLAGGVAGGVAGLPTGIGAIPGAASGAIGGDALGGTLGSAGGYAGGSALGGLGGAYAARKLWAKNRPAGVVNAATGTEQGMPVQASERKMDKLAFYLGYTEGKIKVANLKNESNG